MSTNIVSKLNAWRGLQKNDDFFVVRAVISCPFCVWQIGQIVESIGGGGGVMLQILMPAHQARSHVIYNVEGGLIGNCPSCMVSFVWDGEKIIFSNDYDRKLVSEIVDITSFIEGGLDDGDTPGQVLDDLIGA